jgi:hypothetical protein
MVWVFMQPVTLFKSRGNMLGGPKRAATALQLCRSLWFCSGGVLNKTGIP